MPNFTGTSGANTWTLHFADISGISTNRGDGAGGTDTLILDLSAFAGSVAYFRGDDSGSGGFGPATDSYQLSTGETVWFKNFEKFQISGGHGNDSLTDISGGSNDVLNGNQGNDSIEVNGGADTVDGGTGFDTLQVDYGAAGGGISTTGFALGTLDSLKGKISDGIGNTVNFDNIANLEINTGTATANDVIGTGAGDDYIAVQAGFDIINGGEGVDGLEARYIGATGAITISALAAGTTDGNKGAISDGTVTHRVQFDNIEKFAIYTAAGAFNDTLVTAGGSDAFVVFAGADTVDGKGGSDTLAAIYADSTHAVTASITGNGTVDGIKGNITDTVGNSVAFDNIDSLSVQGSDFADNIVVSRAIPVQLIGNGGNDSLNGGSNVDDLQGGDNNDLLTGGAGADDLDGGSGSDGAVYTGSTAGVTVNLTVAGVQTSAGDANGDRLTSIENLAGSNLADTLTGDGNANFFKGGGGADHLNGGAGADTLDGGTGDDLLYVDNAGDVVKEAASGGSDRVLASVSYTLGAAQEVELFTTTSAAGTTAINLTGNELVQRIDGNAGANVIDGKGGADTMNGGGGNDKLVVDNAGDVANEAASGGSDRVLASLSYTLKTGQSIELFTTTNASATTAINLTGNELAQTINGNAGANTIAGKGGNDTLVGFGGNDTFLFDTAPNASTNVDSITDFTHGADKIKLENAIFTALTTPGTLAAGAFFIGSAAHDADDRIVYNSTTGALIYDSNGNAAGGATQFATLATGLALTNTDFVVA